jgi:hypothetical protein
VEDSVTETVEWEYEYRAEDGEVIWIREDDQYSAGYKAKSRGATGRIRSRTVMTVRSPWRIQ